MITIAQMKDLEDKSEKLGISKLQLMENAGRGIYKTLKEKFPNLKDKKILIVAYHGNNGGDGFTAARYLCDEVETDILFIGDESKLKQEAAINYRRILNNAKIQLFYEFSNIDFNDYDIIIDALLGIGIIGDIKEPIASTIDLINDSNAFKVAIDIPSGINPDIGEVSNKAVNADLIITFHDIKQGLEKFKNKTIIVDIGIKKE